MAAVMHIRTQNTKVLTEENTVENIIYETTAIVSQGYWVNIWLRFVHRDPIDHTSAYL